MQHVISTKDIRLSKQYSYTKNNTSLISYINRFIAWCDAEERNRFLWLGVALMIGIGTIMPITLSAIVFIGGNALPLWIAACIFNVPVLVVNLAAQPTKLTLPVLFAALGVNLVLIGYSVIHFLTA